MSITFTKADFKKLESKTIDTFYASYQFHRMCKLEECDVQIFTNRVQHFFCCTDHHDEYWKRVRMEKVSLHKQVEKNREFTESLDVAFKKLKVAFEGLETKFNDLWEFLHE